MLLLILPWSAGLGGWEKRRRTLPGRGAEEDMKALLDWVAHDWQAEASGRKESLGGIFGGLRLGEEGGAFWKLSRKATAKSFRQVEFGCEVVVDGRSFSGRTLVVGACSGS